MIETALFIFAVIYVAMWLLGFMYGIITDPRIRDAELDLNPLLLFIFCTAIILARGLQK